LPASAAPRQQAQAALRRPGRTAAASAAPLPHHDFGFLRTEPLVNAERAQAVMEREGLDAFIVTQPANVFYLGNHWPNLDRMGFRHSVFVIRPRDPKRPTALVMTGFLHYYRYADDVALHGPHRLPYTTPVDPANFERLGRGADAPPPGPRRESAVGPRATPTQRFGVGRTTVANGSARARQGRGVLGIKGGRIAIDDPAIERLLQSRDVKGSFTPADDHLRRIRLAKSPTEIKLMRIAAQNNVDAGARDGGGYRTLGGLDRRAAQPLLRGSRRARQPAGVHRHRRVIVGDRRCADPRRYGLQHRLRQQLSALPRRLRPHDLRRP
jgi:hypothetical protein